MSTRGTALGRAIRFFREAELDVARVAYQLVQEIVEQRQLNEERPEPQKRTRRHRKPHAHPVTGTATTADEEFLREAGA